MMQPDKVNDDTAIGSNNEGKDAALRLARKEW